MVPEIVPGYICLHQGIEKFVLKGSPIDWKGVNKVDILREFKEDEAVGIRDSQGVLIGIGAVSKKSKEI